MEKLKGAAIKSEFGRIFRQYNVIEYKSPDDGLPIDGLVKTVGHACLYKIKLSISDHLPIFEINERCI